MASLLHDRSVGRTPPHVFWNAVATQKSQLSLLDDPQVASPHKGAIPSLHMDRNEGRFLLAGAIDATISIYDLSKWGTDHYLTGKSPSARSTSLHHDCYKPVARSVRVPYGDPMEVPPGHSHSVVVVQWYPVDAGAFVSASAEGSILVWDTQSMTPVVRWSPFASSSLSSSIRCMHLSTSSGRSESLLAVGSVDNKSVKLVDMRSGASSHSLVGHGGGITAVQWSPSSDVVLVSGGMDGAVRLWDIRKSGSRSTITILDRDHVSDTRVVARPFQADYAHLTYTEASNHHPKQKPQLAPNNYRNAENTSVTSHGGPVSAVSFTPDGHSLVSTGKDGKLQVWDLRGSNSVATLVPLQFLSQIHHQPAVSCTRTQIPLLVQYNGSENTAWVGHGSQLVEYSLVRGGRPTQVLEGHLHTVTALERIENSMRLVSAGKDGMILSWGAVPRTRNLPKGPNH